MAGGGKGGNAHIWLLTYADFITLLMAFFVMLVGMSMVDSKRQSQASDSLSGVFVGGGNGPMAGGRNLLADKDTKAGPPGPLEGEASQGGHEEAPNMSMGDTGDDIRFIENRTMQITSISADLLFEGGSSTLSPKGLDYVAKMVPTVMSAECPVLIAGHAGGWLEETGRLKLFSSGAMGPEWRLSLERALAMYVALKDRGVPADRLLVAGYGSERPRYSQTNALGRRMNRRVEIVLDKRCAHQQEMLRSLEAPKADKPKDVEVKGFRFDTTVPTNPAAPGKGN